MRPPVFEEAAEHKRSWNLLLMKWNWNVCCVNMKWTPPTQSDTCTFMMFGLLQLLSYHQMHHCVPICCYYISQNPFGRPACSIQLLDRNHEMNEDGWSAPTPRTTTEPATGEQTVTVWIALRWCHQTIWAVNAGGFKNDTIDHSQ